MQTGTPGGGTALDEVAEEFGGEDPFVPPVRRILDQTHQELAELPRFLDTIHVGGRSSGAR